MHLSVRALEDCVSVTYEIIQRWHSVLQRWTHELRCSIVSGSTIPVFETVNACILHQISNLNSLPQYITHQLTMISHLCLCMCVSFSCANERDRAHAISFVACMCTNASCVVCLFFLCHGHQLNLV